MIVLPIYDCDEEASDMPNVNGHITLVCVVHTIHTVKAVLVKKSSRKNRSGVLLANMNVIWSRLRSQIQQNGSGWNLGPRKSAIVHYSDLFGNWWSPMHNNLPRAVHSSVACIRRKTLDGYYAMQRFPMQRSPIKQHKSCLLVTTFCQNKASSLPSPIGEPSSDPSNPDKPVILGLLALLCVTFLWGSYAPALKFLLSLPR